MFGHLNPRGRVSDFKECRNREARKLNEHDRRNFKDLCNALLEAVSSTAYEKLLHQLFLTDNETLSVVGNFYSVIPQNLMYKQGTNITRKEIKQEIISNDPHSKNQQDWTLELKKKKTSPHPRCRACRRIQNENELTVNITGSMSLMNRISFRCFFPKQKCINIFRIGQRIESERTDQLVTSP